MAVDGNEVGAITEVYQALAGIRRLAEHCPCPGVQGTR